MCLGFPGFVVFLCFYANCLLSASYHIRASEGWFLKAAAVFCLTALTSALIVTVLDQFVWAQRGALFLGGVIGVLALVALAQRRPLDADAANAMNPRPAALVST